MAESRTNYLLIALAVLCVALIGTLGYVLGRGTVPPPKKSREAPAPGPVTEAAAANGSGGNGRAVEAPKPRPVETPVAEPVREREPEPEEDLSSVAPSSPGATIRFDDIDEACGDLASLRNYLCLVNRGSEQAAGGARLVIGEDLATFTGRGTFNNGVSISIEGKERYSLDFGPPKGKALVPGLYTGAMRWPFNEGPYPGIDVTVGSSGCNTEDGRFRIRQISINGDKLRRFVADFETTCNGAIGRIALGDGSGESDILLRRSSDANKEQPRFR